MKQITLTKGEFALVDDDDFDRLNQIKWHVQQDKHTHYACHAWRDGKKRGLTYMQKMVIDCPPGMQIDHANGNGLDNRKSNLRICTQAQNARNRRSWRKDGYKGVILASRYKRKNWTARISIDGKSKHLGRFLTKQEAARAYNNAAKKYHGEFARLNEID